MPSHILVTGGAGYIGSHTCVELMAAGFLPVIVDNLVNSKREAVRRIERIAGRAPVFVEADVRDGAALDRVFAAYPIDAVVHFAGLKAVGESVAKPLLYYDNNVHGTLGLVEAMQRAGVKRLVFSSSATVYGDPHTVPIREDFPIQTTNPYGASKAMVERVLTDVAATDAAWRIALLRYFNPVGAHESGLIGEDPSGIPNNLMPYVAQVAVGKLQRLTIHGDDYPTRDGTGERGLHPRRRPGPRPPRGARAPRRDAGRRADQPRHRARQHGARDDRDLRRGVGARRRPRRRSPAAGRYRELLRRGRSCRVAPRLARGVRARSHVRRYVALAAGEPGRLRLVFCPVNTCHRDASQGG